MYLTPDAEVFLWALLVGFLQDYAYARWTIAVTKGNSLQAGSYAAIIGGFSLAVAKSFLFNGYPIMFGYCLGLALGTVFAMRTSPEENLPQSHD